MKGPRCDPPALGLAPEARPTREEAFSAFCTLLAFLGSQGRAPAASYSQDSLPPGLTRDGFLRRHRDRFKARTPGWSRVGQTRLVTPDAWAADVEAEAASARRRPGPTAPSGPANDISAELDRALGIRTRGAR